MIGAMTARPPLVLQRKTDCLPRAIETVLRGCRVTTPFTSQDVDDLCGWSPVGADIYRAANVLKFFGLEARLALRPMAANILDALTRGPVIASVRSLSFEGGRRTHEDTIDAALCNRETYLMANPDPVPRCRIPGHAVVAWRAGFVGGRKLIDVLCPTLGRGRVTVRRFVDSLNMPWIGHDLTTWRAGMVDAIEDAARALGIAEEVARHIARANDWRALCHAQVCLERVREARTTGARWSRREALRQLRAPWNPELWPARSVDGDVITARVARIIEIANKGLKPC